MSILKPITRTVVNTYSRLFNPDNRPIYYGMTRKDAEARFRLEEFKKADKDGDGIISPKESSIYYHPSCYYQGNKHFEPQQVSDKKTQGKFDNIV